MRPISKKLLKALSPKQREAHEHQVQLQQLDNLRQALTMLRTIPPDNINISLWSSNLADGAYPTQWTVGCPGMWMCFWPHFQKQGLQFDYELGHPVQMVGGVLVSNPEEISSRLFGKPGMFRLKNRLDEDMMSDHANAVERVYRAKERLFKKQGLEMYRGAPLLHGHSPDAAITPGHAFARYARQLAEALGKPPTFTATGKKAKPPSSGPVSRYMYDGRTAKKPKADFADPYFDGPMPDYRR